MNISTYSRNHILEGMAHWDLPKDFAEAMINYLLYGFSPGSFFTAVLANDFMAAMRCSHPANSIQALKNLCGWIAERMPLTCRGSYDNVQGWLDLSDDRRRDILVNERLAYTEKQETWMSLQGRSTQEPMLF